MGGPIRIQVSGDALLQGFNTFVTSITEGSGSGGRIDIQAGGRLTLDQPAVWVKSTGTGRAGDINLNAGNRLQATQAAINAQADQADGGQIFLNAESLQLDHTPVTATVFGGSGNGGNLTLQAVNVAALNGSHLTARADLGHGGVIQVNSQVFLKTPEVRLDASSHVAGNDGRVEVNAPSIDISGSLVTLPKGYLQGLGIVHRACDVPEGRRSSLVVRERGGVGIAPCESGTMMGTMQW
ncbi:hypothetical protein CCP4SC76_7220008 [Gammaproteobacteria bacterium]